MTRVPPVASDGPPGFTLLGPRRTPYPASRAGERDLVTPCARMPMGAGIRRISRDPPRPRPSRRRGSPGASSCLEESCATVHAVGISRPPPLRVSFLGARSDRDLSVHDLPAVRTEPHRHDRAPVIVVGTTLSPRHSLSPSWHSCTRRVEICARTGSWMPKVSPPSTSTSRSISSATAGRRRTGAACGATCGSRNGRGRLPPTCLLERHAETPEGREPPGSASARGRL